MMKEIYTQATKYGTDKNSGQVDYVKGANIAGFVRVAEAMLAQGVV
jgi:glutamate dehydrogenase (NADP+)